MSWFDNLGLRYKLLVNFLASGGILIAALLFALAEINISGKHTESMASNWVPSLQAVGEISDGV